MKTLTGIAILAAAVLSFAGSAKAASCEKIGHDNAVELFDSLGINVSGNETAFDNVVDAQIGSCEAGVKARKEGVSQAEINQVIQVTSYTAVRRNPSTAATLAASAQSKSLQDGYDEGE